MKNKNPIIKWLGLGIIIFALLFIPVIAYVPFMPFSTKTKAVIVASLVIGGQVLNVIGALLLGKELFARYRKQLNPFNWFKKK
jgi:hypothetical protein